MIQIERKGTVKLLIIKHLRQIFVNRSQRSGWSLCSRSGVRGFLFSPIFQL